MRGVVGTGSLDVSMMLLVDLNDMQGEGDGGVERASGYCGFSFGVAGFNADFKVDFVFGFGAQASAYLGIEGRGLVGTGKDFLCAEDRGVDERSADELVDEGDGEEKAADGGRLVAFGSSNAMGGVAMSARERMGGFVMRSIVSLRDGRRCVSSRGMLPRSLWRF